MDKELFELLFKNNNMNKHSPSGGKMIDIDEKDFIRVIRRTFFKSRKFRKMVFQKIASVIQEVYWD